MRHAARRRPHALVLALLLVCTLGLATMLAYEAHDAARSHRATAERALHDYAAVAAWEFVAGVGDRLQTTLGPAFAPIRARAISPYELLPAPTIIAASAGDALRCPAASSDESSRYYFRVDFRDGTLATNGASPSAASRRWLVDTITAHVRAVYQPDWLYAILREGDVAIAYAVKYAEHRAPIAAYGLSTCAAGIGPALFRDVLARRPLLPASVTGGAANDSLVAIDVSDASSRLLFQSVRSTLSPYLASAPLDQAGGLFARATIRPRAVELLAIGAIPESRVPLLVGLLTLTAAMIVLAVLQLRREHELSRLRADFISSVSHELRTPLSQILLFAETLNLGRVRSDAERRAASEVIVHEGRRLMHLVENILHFSRAERRMTHLEPQPVALAAAVQTIVDDWLPLAGSMDAHVRSELDPDAIALADPSALRQMLFNLLDNAVKYGRAGQTITIGARRHGERARIWVDDQGTGVPSRDRQRVWESFYRLERHANSAVAGSGIGLYVVRELARLHGGDAWVEDAPPPGGGARFVIELVRAGDRSMMPRVETEHDSPSSLSPQHPAPASR